MRSLRISIIRCPSSDSLRQMAVFLREIIAHLDLVKQRTWRAASALILSLSFLSSRVRAGLFRRVRALSDKFEHAPVCRRRRELIRRCCQTNANQSQFTAKRRNPSRTKLAPSGESDGSGEFKIISAVESAFLVEMVMEGGVDNGEVLQSSHAPEAQHRPLPSSKWQV